MFSRVQLSSPAGSGSCLVAGEKEEEPRRESHTQEEGRRETRVRDGGKQIEGHVQGSAEERE